jgi:16S rRNA (cytosine967-C5)-methyltransferase
MAELMQNSGELTAVDLYEQKLLKTENHSRALGITIITTAVADARSYVPEKRPDSILLDVPCSGTGVLGRRAELRWKLTTATLQELQTLQAELLDHAAELLDKDGILVYATCSIEPEENALQIEAFLQRHPDFAADPVSDSMPEAFRHGEKGKGAILTMPGQYPGFDGGFCQRLRKTRHPADGNAA